MPPRYARLRYNKTRLLAMGMDEFVKLAALLPLTSEPEKLMSTMLGAMQSSLRLDKIPEAGVRVLDWLATARSDCARRQQSDFGDERCTRSGCTAQLRCIGDIASFLTASEDRP